MQLSNFIVQIFILDMKAHWARRFHVKKMVKLNLNLDCMTRNNALDRTGDVPARKRHVTFQKERVQHRDAGGHDFSDLPVASHNGTCFRFRK